MCDEYAPVFAETGIRLAEQFVKSLPYPDVLVRMLRNADTTTYSATLIGRLRAIFAGSRHRAVSVTVGRTVSDMRTIRLAPSCGRDMVKCLEEEVRAKSPPQGIGAPFDK